MRILLLGKNGQVGWELQRALAPLGAVTALDFPEVDFLDLDGLLGVVRGHDPQLIVNAAAYTAVDQAEQEPEKAMTINGVAPGLLAEEAKRLGVGLVHYSTDYVFDGTKQEPYTEDDVPRPINVYGESKLAGDRAIMAVDGAYLILRTSWIYGARGKNFFLTIRRVARERQDLHVVDDQVGTPTWCRFLAETTVQILNALQGGGSGRILPALSARPGVYNLSAEGQVSWFGFAKAILATDPAGGEIRAREVLPTTSQAFPTLAQRPSYSVLSKAKARMQFGLELPSWEDQLDGCWKALATEGGGHGQSDARDRSW